MTDFTSPISHSTSARLERNGKMITSPCWLCNQMDHRCKDCPLWPTPSPKSIPFRFQHEKMRPCGSSLNTPAAAIAASSSSSKRKRYEDSLCYSCGQKGHWSKDCPSKTKGSSSRKVRKNYPRCMCKCGVPRVVRTSTKNPGKDFYICPKMQGEQCKESFIWCDKAEKLGLCEDKPDPADQYPICRCGAGKCSLLTVQEGELAGCQYFGCMIKEQGEQCKKSFIWCDEAEKLGLCDDKPDPADQYPICSCGAGKCRLLTVQEGELAGCQYFGCMIKEGHGCCTHFEWYTSPINNEPNKINGGENMLPHINLLAEGLKSSPIVDVRGVEIRAQSIPDEVVVPATTEARSEQRTNSVEYLPLGWLNPQDATNSDETVVQVSPPPPTRRKLEFDDAGPDYLPIRRPSLQNASPSNEKESHWASDSFGVIPSPSLKDGFGEIVVPNSLSLPPTVLDTIGAVDTNDTAQVSSMKLDS